jgi:DNA-binding NtrC family response regulator
MTNDEQNFYLLGDSVAVTHLRAQVQRVGPYFRAALLTGEPGCGDEAVARALHAASPMADRMFLRLTARESETRFARREGPGKAFTEGMLYLPEIERLSPEAQAGLLRLIRERSPQTPRLVAYSPRGLRAMVSAGAFSSDLAAMLGVVRVGLPPLRERAGDIAALMDLALGQAASSAGMTVIGLAPGFIEAAERFDWTGNLEQVLATARWLVEHRAGGVLRAEDLCVAVKALARQPESGPPQVRMVPLDQVVQEHIRAVLVGCNGNKLRAAEVLGISRSTLYRMLDAGSSDSALDRIA